MYKKKLSEEEVDRKIAMLREKNKIIERKHQMQLKEKQLVISLFNVYKYKNICISFLF